MSDPSRSAPGTREEPPGPEAPGALARDLLTLWWGRRRSRPTAAAGGSQEPSAPSPPPTDAPAGLTPPTPAARGPREGTDRSLLAADPLLGETPRTPGVPRHRVRPVLRIPVGTPTIGDLGEAIGLLRGSRSQTEVARSAGLSRASWSLYELGKRRPRPAQVEGILRGLGCTRDQHYQVTYRVYQQRTLGEALDLGCAPAITTVDQLRARLREVLLELADDLADGFALLLSTRTP